jgi:hypothetical protein
MVILMRSPLGAAPMPVLIAIGIGARMCEALYSWFSTLSRTRAQPEDLIICTFMPYAL